MGPDGLEGVTGGRPLPVGARSDWLGGAGASRDCWSGLGVERSMGRAEGASGVVGAGLPSSATSLASSRLQERADSSSSEGGVASG